LTIKDLLGGLSSKEKALLMYAFEHDLSQYVTLKGNGFIGVNVTHIQHLEIEQSTGVWAAGKVKG